MSHKWELVNPGYMNRAGGYAEQSVGRELKGAGASKADIDGCSGQSVRQSQASGNKQGNKGPPPSPDA